MEKQKTEEPWWWKCLNLGSFWLLISYSFFRDTLYPLVSSFVDKDSYYSSRIMSPNTPVCEIGLSWAALPPKIKNARHLCWKETWKPHITRKWV